jgi:signal transduction histidine kinase
VLIDLIIEPKQREVYFKKLQERMEGIEEAQISEVYKKSGERILVSSNSKILYNDYDKPFGYVLTFIDVTEEQRKVEDLKAFSSSAAHDLNSPLTKITSLIEFFDIENLNEEQRNYLQIIDTTAKNMKQLLSDLLSFSRLGSNALPKEEINLNVLLADVCKFIVPDTYQGKLILHDLPSIYGNESAIRQLFTNLISNAIKYSSKVDEPEVEVGFVKNEGTVEFYVKDNGVGLEPDQLAQLFTPFKRFHSKFEGNGLGLAIVKRIIEKHGGKTHVESKVNEGLCFYFTIAPLVG